MKTHFLILALFVSTSVYAATPTPGDILRQTKKPDIVAPKKRAPSFEVDEYKVKKTNEDKVTILIKGFSFTGNSSFSDKQLQTVVKAYKNRQMGINALNQITSVVTKFYRDKGFFLAKAYIPKQNMENGIIEIRILEGSFGNFNIKNNSKVNTSEIEGFFNILKDKTVSLSKLERQILLANDVAAAQIANMRNYAGEKPGTSDFEMDVKEQKKIASYFSADNTGSVYTGEIKLNIGTSINNLSGSGDRLDMSAMTSNTTNIKNIQSSYSKHLGYSGLKGTMGASFTKYKLDKINNYEAHGESYDLNASLSYPIIKQKTHTQQISATLKHQNLDDTSGIPGSTQESKKSINSLMLNLSDQRNINATLPASLYSSLGLTIGDLNLDNQVAVNNDTSLDSEGIYTKLNADLIYNQVIMEDVTLKTTLKGQFPFSKNLDSVEDFSISGMSGVRAYESSELSGDKGYFVSLEATLNLPSVKQVQHNTSLFVDHGRVWKNSEIFNSEDNTRALSAIGVGYKAQYKTAALQATFAHGFGSDRTPTSESAFSTNQNKFFIQLSYSF